MSIRNISDAFSFHQMSLDSGYPEEIQCPMSYNDGMFVRRVASRAPTRMIRINSFSDKAADAISFVDFFFESFGSWGFTIPNVTPENC